ncbi:MAG: ion transporter [Pseudomonadota bacterium]
MRKKIRILVDGAFFQIVVLILIVANAIILGAETFPNVISSVGPFLMEIDRFILYAFIAEIGLRIIAYGPGYFRTGWNLFDFTIVLVSLLAATSGLAALRAFRVLRVLRVITVIPRMRVVVSALLDSLPGIASVGVVLALIIYVFAVIASNLYGADHPARFGDVFAAMYTLFQIMTLEGWPDIAARVGQTHPNSWFFFLSFVLLATFTMLNLFVAIVVRVVEEDSDPWFDDLIDGQKALTEEIAALRAEVAALSLRDRDKG